MRCFSVQEYRVVEKKQIAFVRYYYRMNAEFAREVCGAQACGVLTASDGVGHDGAAVG